MIITKYFPFEGGENLADPIMSMKPGELVGSYNYECAPQGGYTRVKGFERVDGQPSPCETVESDYATLALWKVGIEARRTDILAIPGSGSVRGIFRFDDVLYGFRNSANGLVGMMYKSTAAGWVVVTMDETLTFSLGESVIAIGDTITGKTGSATATVTHVRLDSGTWAGSDAAGVIYYNPSTLTGVFEAEIITVSGTDCATIAGVGTATAFSPNGTYEFITTNFYGASSSVAVYGVNGVNQGFSFDGSDVIFINTGMTIDTPDHIFTFKKHLFFSFPGGSVQHSSPGTPYTFSAITGAAELAIGDDCVGFVNTPGDALAIFARNSISLLYGTSVADWELKAYSLDSGAIAGTIQDIGLPFFLDDRGLKKLTTTADYGDFNMSTVSQKIKPFLDDQRGKASCSIKVKNKDQYRLFYTDGQLITVTFDNGKVKGITRGNLGKTITCAVSAEDNNGEEVLYVGDDAGFVYQLDKGPSFDGGVVTAYLRLPFYHFKNPENLKQFFKVVLEIEAEAVMDMNFLPEFSYGDINFPVAEESEIVTSAGSGYWGDISWGEFYWDSQSVSNAYGYLEGLGKNFRLYIVSSGTYEEGHTIQGAIVHYSNKGRVK